MGAERPPLLLVLGEKMTPQQFRQKQKELLGELQRQTGAAPTWTDPQLDSWRDDEIGTLYSKGLYKISSTRLLAGWTETTIPTYSTGTVQRYFAVPATMRKVVKVEFIDPTTDEVVGFSSRFDSSESTGFIRLDQAHGFEGYKVRLVGEVEYTTIEELPREVADVCAYGSIIRALTGEYVQRQRSARRRVSSRTTDVSPGAIAAGIGVMMAQYKEKIKNALSIQDVRVFRS